jgi:hypothetical protein
MGNCSTAIALLEVRAQMCNSRALLSTLLLAAASAGAADFGHKGGPEPSNIDEVAQVLRADPYDMELLVSFGTSKGGSAGHFALALRGEGADDDLVYSANFYADRSPEHEKDRYTADLMVRIPKMEYLYRTASSLGDKAAFGLDFGEVYKRSVVGIRVYGVPAAERAALVAFFARMNADYRARATDTEYHDGEVKYEYMRLNCAKTIGSAFKYGAGYRDLEVKSVDFLPGRKIATLRNANIPTEMAMKLMKAWDARGYRMDVVLYRKYPASAYVDPLEDEKVAFRDLPNRFPSVMSLDFRNDQGRYEDYDNLLAMYLLYNLGRYGVRIDEGTKRIEIAREMEPMGYAPALELAAKNAEADSKGFLRRLVFRPRGKSIGDPAEVVPSESRNRPPGSR